MKLTALFSLLCLTASLFAQSAAVKFSPATGELQEPLSLSADAWKLIGTGVTATITPSQYGMGWADSRFTVQTPVGAMQFYYAGSPAEPVIYWPGRLVTTNFESVTITGSLSASLLTSGTIATDVMGPSLPSPLQQWQMGELYARLNGLTYVTDTDLGFGQLEPTVGVWYPQVNVVSGGLIGLNYEVGRYRSASQFRADLAVPEVVAAPATATSTGTAGQIAYDASYFYVCVATNTWKRAALATW